MFLRKTKCRNDEKSGRRRKKLLLRPLPLSCLLHLIGLILLGLVLHNNAVQSEEQPPEAEIVMETAEAEMPPEAVPEEQKQDTSSSEQQETPKRCRQGRPLLQPRAVRLRPQRLALEKDRRQVLPARRTAAAVTMALQLLPAVLPILRILLLAPAVRKATPTSPRVLPPASRPIKNIRILPSALAKQAA